MPEFNTYENRKIITEINERWADRINAQPKACFTNAAKVVAEIVEVLHSNPTLVEGYAVAVTLDGTVLPPMEHAWVEITFGVSGRVVIDPTWTEGATVYHPIARHTKAEVEAAIENEQTFPLHFPIHKGMTADEYMEMLKSLMEQASSK